MRASDGGSRGGACPPLLRYAVYAVVAATTLVTFYTMNVGDWLRATRFALPVSCLVWCALTRPGVLWTLFWLALAFQTWRIPDKLHDYYAESASLIRASERQHAACQDPDLARKCAFESREDLPPEIRKENYCAKALLEKNLTRWDMTKRQVEKDIGWAVLISGIDLNAGFTKLANGHMGVLQAAIACFATPVIVLSIAYAILSRCANLSPPVPEKPVPEHKSLWVAPKEVPAPVPAPAPPANSSLGWLSAVFGKTNGLPVYTSARGVSLEKKRQ